jgi:hypothetical protein
VNKLRPTVSALVKISPRNETLPVKSVTTVITIATSTRSTSSTSTATISSTVASTSKVVTTERYNSTSKVSTSSRKHALKLSSETHRSVGTEARSASTFWSTPGINGAVAALSLGIMITAILLVYAGCRFRRIRKISLRRYRPVGNNDADYLVNGMYL